MRRRALLAAAATLPFAPARAAEWPDRPVRLIVPFAAGGSTDLLSRLMAERMMQTLGQTVLVENRAGGNTIVGAEYVARAQPDGNTLLMAAGTTPEVATQADARATTEALFWMSERNFYVLFRSDPTEAEYHELAERLFRIWARVAGIAVE